MDLWTIFWMVVLLMVIWWMRGVIVGLIMFVGFLLLMGIIFVLCFLGIAADETYQTMKDKWRKRNI